MADTTAIGGGPIPVPTQRQPLTLSGLQKLLTGYQFEGLAGWLILFILTICPGIGSIGLNHVAVGQPDVAFIKAASMAVSYLLMVFLAPYLPLAVQNLSNGSLIFWIAGIGPWYIFDIIQIIFQSHFMSTGFIPLIDVPFLSSGGGKGGKWKLSATFANLVFATLGGSGQVLSYFFPDASIAGNVISIIGGVGLGISLLASGAAMFASPVTAVSALSGGGMSSTALPPLSQIIDKVQNGGGKKEDPSAFLYGLGLVAVAGISLGVIRSKQ